VAIALNELGLIALPAKHLNVPVLSKQTNDPQGIKRLNFARLVTIYTRKFEASNPVEAIYYFYLLRAIKSSPDENLFFSSVSRLVRESKDFNTLLGHISDDGCRIPGVVDKFDSAERIIDQIAVDCEKQGLFEEAIRLFDLGNKQDEALRLFNKLLCNVVAERKGDARRDRLEKFSLELAERYCQHGTSATREVAATFYLLLDLMTFFDYYHSESYADALDTIQKLKIVPLQSTEVDLKVHEFGQHSEEVRRNVPDILLATMSILYAQFKEAKSLTSHSINKFGITAEVGNKEQRCADMRQKARALITFAGMIPYRMPGDTNARLVQLEVLMN
jgi:nuclear pore complex protein Nup93